MYYLRTRPAANAIQFTVDQKLLQETRQNGESEIDHEKEAAALACSIQNKEACLMCTA